MMAKTVRKWTPADPYDCIALETWLEDMARKGFLLKKFRPLFCTFERGEPAELRYRVEPWKRHWDDGLPQDMLELYADCGWEYVGEISRDLLIFSARDPDAPEPHSDPELQRGQWERVRKSLLRGALGIAATLLLVLAGTVYSLWREGRPILDLVTSNTLFLLPLLSFYPFHIAGLLRQERQIAKITQQLQEGIPLEHRAMYLRRGLTGLAGFVGTVVLFVMMLATRWFFPYAGGPARNLDELEDFVPLSLSSLEPAPYREEHFVMDGVDYANFCDRERYPFCWTYWDVVQSGSRGEFDDQIRLEIEWYDPLIDPLAAPLARESLLHYISPEGNRQENNLPTFWEYQAGFGEGTWTVTERVMDGVDYLAVARRGEDDFQLAAAAAQGRAAVARYTGTGDLEDHLEEIAAMVTERRTA